MRQKGEEIGEKDQILSQEQTMTIDTCNKTSDEEQNDNASIINMKSRTSRTNSVSTDSSRRSSASSMSTRQSRSSRRFSMQNHVKHFVEHDYHDHLHDTFKDDFQSIAMSDAKKRRGHRGGVAVPFPEKLHYMLSRMDDEGTSDIVTWQPHGRCFTVHNSREFVEKIMPR
jgi:hypothetical protein